jgi:type I restriction enzyme, S subunit
MVASELGEIPEGWRVGKLGDVANITIGRTPPRQEKEWFTVDSNDIKWISIKDMGNAGVYIINTSEYLTKKAVDTFNIPIIKSNTVIVSFKLTVGRVAITTENMLSNEAIAHINLVDNINSVEYMYLFLKQFNFSKLGSTSSIATAVNSKSLKQLILIIPHQNTIEKFTLQVNAIFKKILLNTNQIQTLTKTRDELLPKLMKGEIRVRDEVK